MAFCEGDDVVLRSLVSRSELNGRLGQLRRWDDAAGRWQVVFHPRDGGGGCKVKPSNLALATADDRANGRHVDAEEIDALERLRGTFGDDISPPEDELHRCDSDGDCEGRDFSQLQQFYLILQKQHPGVAISKKAIQIINAFAEDCARRVATTAANVASTQRRAVLRVEALSRAVGLLIPSPLREACLKHARASLKKHERYQRLAMHPFDWSVQRLLLLGQRDGDSVLHKLPPDLMAKLFAAVSKKVPTRRHQMAGLTLHVAAVARVVRSLRLRARWAAISMREVDLYGLMPWDAQAHDGDMRVDKGVCIILTGVVEFMCKEVIRLCGQAANREGRRIVPRHVATSIRNDPGLRTFMYPQDEDEDDDEDDDEEDEDDEDDEDDDDSSEEPVCVVASEEEMNEMIRRVSLML